MPLLLSDTLFGSWSRKRQTGDKVLQPCISPALVLSTSCTKYLIFIFVMVFRQQICFAGFVYSWHPCLLLHVCNKFCSFFYVVGEASIQKKINEWCKSRFSPPKFTDNFKVCRSVQQFCPYAESLVNCIKIVEHNCLGYVFVVRSSRDATIRSTAYHELAPFCFHQEGVRFADKTRLLYLLDCLRKAVTNRSQSCPASLPSS